jgi:hypothetical protein
MVTLTVNQNQLDYIGVFEKPAFNLMGEGRQIIEGLYYAFSPYQVSLADFRLEETPTAPSNFGVNVHLKSLGHYRFKFDRLEWTVLNFDGPGLSTFPDVLRRSEEWLRSAVPDFSFRSHMFFYAGHCHLSQGTSQDFLLRLAGNDVIDLGENLGSGVIKNWRDSRVEGRFQLIVDHSLSVKNGLFVQLTASLERDKIDYSSMMEIGQETLSEVLNKIGLRLETEQEVE